MPPHEPSTPLGLQVAIGIIDGGCLLIWLLVAWKSLVRYQPRRPVPWTGIDLAVVLLLALLSFFTAEAILQWANGGPLPKNLNATILGVNCAAEFAALVLGVAWLMLRARATWFDLGLAGSRLGYFIGLGLLAYLVSVMPVQSLLEVLTKLLDQHYDHDVIKALKESGEDSRWIWAGLLVVVVGPICEEMFFRVALQGWLESLSWPGTRKNTAARRELDLAAAPPELAVVDPANPYQAPQASAASAHEHAESPDEPVLWQPIVFSSAAFALMHSSLAQIPLFCFALVLGYLYQRTHRLWPSLVTHMLLNGGSLATLWVYIHVLKKPIG